MSEAGIGISRGGGRRDVLFAGGARCGLSGDGTGTGTGAARVGGGGKDVLLGMAGGGGTRARAAARSAPTAGAGGIGAGGSGRVTRGGAISLSLVLTSSVESAGSRCCSPSACACAAPESSVAYWPDAAVCTLGSLSPSPSPSPYVSECCLKSAACVNASTSPSSCVTRVCASSQSIAPSNGPNSNESSPRSRCNGACTRGSDSMKQTEALHQHPVRYTSKIE